MARLATMGASSCATIAIQGFKTVGDETAYEANEKYLLNPKAFTKTIKDDEGRYCVAGFYNNILYPTDQQLGRTADYPFDALVDAIEKTSMKDKFIITVLNNHQKNFQNGYWPRRLEARGFKLIDKSKNNIGSMNWIYVRNLARPDDFESSIP